MYVVRWESEKFCKIFWNSRWFTWIYHTHANCYYYCFTTAYYSSSNMDETWGTLYVYAGLQLSYSSLNKCKLQMQVLYADGDGRMGRHLEGTTPHVRSYYLGREPAGVVQYIGIPRVVASSVAANHCHARGQVRTRHGHAGPGREKHNNNGRERGLNATKRTVNLVFQALTMQTLS
jgi:hypothetical protein